MKKPVKRQALLADIIEGMASMRRLIATSCAASGASHIPTRAQIGILFILAHGEVRTLKDVAARLCMSSSAATQLVEGLVRAKLVSRKGDTGDRRKILLSLTDTGKKKLAEVHAENAKRIRKMFTPLSDAELRQWLTLQKKIMVNQN